MASMKASLNIITDHLPEPLSTLEWTLSLMFSVAIGALTMVLILYYVWFKKSKQVIRSPNSGLPKPRFRKRDKVLFYGRKMLRRVRSFAKTSITSGRRTTTKKRLLVMKLARKLLQFQKEQQPQLRAREPPPSFLEADWPELWQADQRLPAEMCYLLKSVRVLGHFEKPIFLELCRFMESRFVPAGTHLFSIGDQDDSIFVVQTGRVNVYICDHEGVDHCVNEVGTGESIHSLLSLMDVLTGHTDNYKTVSAVAMVDSTVIRLPVRAFQLVLERFPESMVRMVQIIMVRLQRVTFMALHNYLGLGSELITQSSARDPMLSVLNIVTTPKGSPMWPNKRTAGDDTEVNPTADGFTPAATNDGTETRRRSSSSRKTSDMAVRAAATAAARVTSAPVVGSDSAPSDFDAACSQAGVAGLELDLAAASSSVSKPSVSESSLTRKASKRTVISNQVTVIPNTSSSGSDHKRQMHHLNDTELLQIATTDIAKLFRIEDEKLLSGKMFILRARSGATLISEGDQNASLYFIICGQLQMMQRVVGKETGQRPLFVADVGEMVGALAVLSGEPSFFSITAAVDTILVSISKPHFYSIIKLHPQVVLHVGYTLLKRTSKFVRQIDFALDWKQVEAGRALYRQGEQAEYIYIILNGRLRSVMTLTNDKKELVGEYGRGEMIGLVEVLTQVERATTMMAIRDTELAQFPAGLLSLVKRFYPQVVTRLIHLLSQKILGSLKSKASSPAIHSALSEHPNVEPRPAVANLSTVAVLAVDDEIPLDNFTLELQHALGAIGSTLTLTSEVIQKKLGDSALDIVNEYRLSSWLCQQEDTHRMVLYQCDYRASAWTRRCVRQADCILILALADQQPIVGIVEQQMENLASRAQKELILLHREGAKRRRGNTVEWLNMRPSCSSHHHLRCPPRMLRRRSKAKTTQLYRKLFETNVDRLSDFSRLARFLTGTSIGLVLGGGGARGLSHVGIIRSMCEAGVPIDMVGGTSIGAFIGALWAEERNVTRFTQRGREWSMGMSSLWKKLLDLTYPITSMFSGSAFNASIEAVFKDRQIEDLLIPFFCITTDITASKMRVHKNGSVWRYVRGSMSLSGYLPPLCDPLDGHLLVDGGYVNNLPADVMRTMGAQTIFAVDVGSQTDVDLTNYGDHLSGWWLLWKRWNPWTASVRVPNLAEIQTRLAYVSCVQQLDQVQNSDYMEYIRPPIDMYSTLQFAAFDKILDTGYQHGKALFSTWERKGLIENIFKDKSVESNEPAIPKVVPPTDPDFTDLAELISRIDEPAVTKAQLPRFLQQYVDDDDDDDDYEDYDDEDDDDEEADRLSVISEPPDINSLNVAVKHIDRTHSEGASPCSTPSDEDETAPENVFNIVHPSNR